MKKLTSLITIISIMAGSSGNTYFKSYEDIYPETAIITETNQEADIVTVQTFNGNLFQFYGIEDYQAGDIVSMIMDSNKTEAVNDDIILSVKYSGYIPETTPEEVPEIETTPEADLFMEYLEAIENGSYTE